MAVTPTQERFIDPYNDIYSDIVDKRLMGIYPDGKGIITGIYLQEDTLNPNNLIITSGICVKDYVVLHFPNNITFDVSTYGDNNYYVVIQYTYNKTTPPPEAQIELVTAGNVGDSIVIGQVDVASGQVVSGSINYNNRTHNALINFLNIIFQDGLITSDIDMNHHKITNLGNGAADITDPLDAVNKEYVDNSTSSMPDEKVKVDDTDGSAGYLNEKIQAGNNIQIQVLDDDLSSPDPGNNHILFISGNDDRLLVISGDNSGVFLNKGETIC